MFSLCGDAAGLAVKGCLYPAQEGKSDVSACVSEGALLASALSSRSAPVGTGRCPRAGAQGRSLSLRLPRHAHLGHKERNKPSSAWGHLLIFLLDFQTLVQNLSWARHDLI